jgi:excisionase family DNA binding protein
MKSAFLSEPSHGHCPTAREGGGGAEPTQPLAYGQIRLLTLRDLAVDLQVSERTIRREVAAGRLHCVRIGRRLLFDPADVFRFVAAAKG